MLVEHRMASGVGDVARSRILIEQRHLVAEADESVPTQRASYVRGSSCDAWPRSLLSSPACAAPGPV